MSDSIELTAKKLQEILDQKDSCYVVGNSDTTLFIYSTNKNEHANITMFDDYPVVEKYVGKVKQG